MNTVVTVNFHEREERFEIRYDDENEVFAVVLIDEQGSEELIGDEFTTVSEAMKAISEVI